MRQLIFCFALALPLSSLATAEDSDGITPVQPREVDAKQALTKLTLTDKSFVEKAAAGGNAEVTLSKLALNKTKDPAVRSFAQKMVRDHTSAGEELQKIAAAKNLSVPAEPDDMHKKVAEKFMALNGTEFDSAYREQMKKDHDKTVDLFTAAADDKSLSAELAAFAKKTLPILRAHQHDAHSLASGKMSSAN